MIKCNECGEDLKPRTDGKPCGYGFEFTDGSSCILCESCLEKWLKGIETRILLGEIDK